MADYKILQNIDLAQNEIKEVSKISNDRSDGKDKKKLLIQTGDNTSLTFSRKDGNNSNSIKGIVKEEISSGKTNESIFTVNPSEVNISNESKTISDANYAISKLTLGLDDNKEHIEAVSPLVDINTGDTEYTDPHISLDKKKSTLGLKSSKIEASSKRNSKSSTLTMEDTIVGVSQGITFKDTDSSPNVSLDLNTDGNISLKASKSITETVDKLSVSLDKSITEGETTQTIAIKNSEESNPSQIEVYKGGVKVSKKGGSYLDVKETSLKGESSTVTIETPNNVKLELKENEKLATLTSNGTITLTSNKGSSNLEASTIYGDNSIVSKADSIKLQTQGYEEKTEDTPKYFSHFPHIELTSKDNNKSILVEGKTIGISSKDEGSNKEDTISLTGTKLNVGSTTTEVTSKDIKVQHKETVLKDGESKEEDILVLEISNNSGSKLIRVPTTTEVDINSTKIGIGDTNSTTTISGSELKVETKTNIEGDSTLSGTTTLQSSKSSPKNTLIVNETSTSITGEQVDINPKTVNIGTATNTEKSVVTTDITIGNNAGGTTKLASKTTSIISTELSVSSGTVKFTGSNISINNTKDDKGKETSSVSLTSNVNTSVKDKVFSVNKGDIPTLKVDTSGTNNSISLAGNSTTITSGSIGIGVSDTTTGITIGKDVGSNITTLQSEETKITSPTVNIGTGTTTSLNIGNSTTAQVNLKGTGNLSITSDTSTSNVTAKTLKFEENISSNDIKIRWDSTLNSLVFEKA